MQIRPEDTAVVFIDPQNDVLSEKGFAWPDVRESLKENNTIENMERIFKAAKAYDFEVFISPHYFYPIDKGWKFNGPLETDEAKRRFVRPQRSPESRRPARLRRRLAGAFQALHRGRQDRRGRAAPRVGPGTNDLVLQLRKRASARSFSAACSPTCASNPTCAN